MAGLGDDHAVRRRGGTTRAGRIDEGDARIGGSPRLGEQRLHIVERHAADLARQDFVQRGAVDLKLAGGVAGDAQGGQVVQLRIDAGDRHRHQTGHFIFDIQDRRIAEQDSCRLRRRIVAGVVGDGADDAVVIADEALDSSLHVPVSLATVIWTG